MSETWWKIIFKSYFTLFQEVFFIPASDDWNLIFFRESSMETRVLSVFRGIWNLIFDSWIFKFFLDFFILENFHGPSAGKTVQIEMRKRPVATQSTESISSRDSVRLVQVDSSRDWSRDWSRWFVNIKKYKILIVNH
jgi:hypothetical protein